MKNSNILILGAQGMLGRAVFLYMSKKYKNNVFGTSRLKSKIRNIFQLSVESFDNDMLNIVKSVKNIDFIINCIALLNKNENQGEIFKINTEFPKRIKEYGEKNKIKIIHVSSDAVFNPLVKKVTEGDTPLPNDLYGKSKLLGEVISSHVLSFRTSLLGFDPIKHKGLLEWAIRSESTICGFVNQFWSGCTVLQFAILCEKIITRNSFFDLRKKSYVFHFTPISAITKYDILKEFSHFLNKEKYIKKCYGSKTTRQLKTLFSNELYLDEFKSDIYTLLKELIEFEKIQNNY